MRRILLVMNMMLVSIVFGVSAFAYVCVDNIYYDLYKKGSPYAKVVAGDKEYSGAVTIPSNIVVEGTAYAVTGIDAGAFKGNKSVTSVVIPNSVTKIEENSFWFCSSLVSVAIGDGVTSIAKKAFWECSALKQVSFGASVSEIGGNAFENCILLKEAKMPDTVTSVGDWAFSGCSSLTALTIGKSVEKIGQSAFENCTSLTSVVVPNKVKEISAYAFKGCAKLANVTLGESLVKLSLEAFSNCNDLTNVYCYMATPPTTYDNPFAGSDIEYANLYVPDESMDIYKSKDVWKNFGTIKPMSSGISEAQMQNIAVQSVSGVVTITGLIDGMAVQFFDIEGRLLGNVKAYAGLVEFGSQPGNVIIAKMGEKRIKILVK